MVIATIRQTSAIPILILSARTDESEEIVTLVWLKLTEYAHCAKITIYKLEQGLRDDCMKQQLFPPKLRFA
jgi:hypothetical protein